MFNNFKKPLFFTANGSPNSFSLVESIVGFLGKTSWIFRYLRKILFVEKFDSPHIGQTKLTSETSTMLFFTEDYFYDYILRIAISENYSIAVPES